MNLLNLPHLSDEQRAHYDEQGYARIPGVFPVAEMTALNDEVCRLQAAEAAEGGRTDGWLFRLGLRSPLMRDFCADPRLLALVDGIVKPGIAIFSAKLVPKLPHDDAVCHWHQDDAWYVESSQSLSRMSVWVPLQDSDEENGCLRVVPRSHSWGPQPWQERESGHCAREIVAPENFDFSQAVPVRAKAGDVVMFSALTWHGSLGNRSERLRHAFVVSYQEAPVEGGNEDQWRILRPA